MAKLSIEKFNYIDKYDETVTSIFNNGMYFNDKVFSLGNYTSERFPYGKYDSMPPTNIEVIAVSDSISSLFDDSTFWFSIPLVVNFSVDMIKPLFVNTQLIDESSVGRLFRGNIYYDNSLVAKGYYGNTSYIYGSTNESLYSQTTPIYFTKSSTTTLFTCTLPIFKEDYIKDGLFNFPSDSAEMVLFEITINTKSSSGYLQFRLLYRNFTLDDSTRPFWTSLNGKKVNYLDTNPYSPGGSSGYGGGGGSFNNDSDTITIPSKPTLSSSNTGFTRIYNPTLSQVQDLASYLWTDETVIETIWNHIKQYFENPMDAMIGFNLVPVQVPNGGQESFKLMYIDTGVTMNTAANQFVDVDCGSLEIQEYYGSALDYSPYTKISCFLPFIGNVSLNVDEVMKKTISITYRVDICSGACVAYISVDGNAIYQFSGHCAIPIPFSSSDFSSYVNAIVSTAKLATAAVVAGASAMGATAVADAAQQTNQVVTTTQVTQTARNPATGRQITTGTTTTVETRESPNDQSSTQASFSGLTPQNVANTVGAIMSSKPHIEHSGSFSGNSGYLGIRRPFIIIERPNMCMPENYQQLNGFPCMITLPLSDCAGFTRVQQVQLTGVKATNPEQSELLELLKSGVIL